MDRDRNRRRGGFKRKQLHYSPNLLSTINSAISGKHVVTIEYDSHEKGVSNRDAEPLAVIYKNRKRNLVAWCRLREDYRSFRLDRINMIKVNEAGFITREDFDVNNFLDQESHIVDTANPDGSYEEE